MMSLFMPMRLSLVVLQLKKVVLLESISGSHEICIHKQRNINRIKHSILMAEEHRYNRR